MKIHSVMGGTLFIGLIASTLILSPVQHVAKQTSRFTHVQHPNGKFTTEFKTPNTQLSVEGKARINLSVTYGPDGTPVLSGTIVPGHDPRADVVKSNQQFVPVAITAQAGVCNGRAPLYTMGFSGRTKWGGANYHGRWSGRVIACKDALSKYRAFGIEKLRMSARGGNMTPNVRAIPDTFWIKSAHRRHRGMGWLDWRPLGTKNANPCKNLNFSIAGKKITLGTAYQLCHGRQDPLEPHNFFTNSGPMRAFGTKFEGKNFAMKPDRTYAISNLGHVRTKRGPSGKPWSVYRSTRFIKWHIDFDTK